MRTLHTAGAFYPKRVRSSRVFATPVPFNLLNPRLTCQDYIKQLIGVMTDVEDLESLEHLHLLCSLMQTIRKWHMYVIPAYTESYDSDARRSQSV